ncbi:unnamed protein product, partial [Polarella glacialis]
MSGVPTSGLAILVDEKRVNDLLAQKSGAKAVVRSMCNTLMFCIFVGTFTALALGEPRSQQRAFEAYVRRRFDIDAVMKLDEVDSVTGFWRYCNASFMPGIYGNDTKKYSYPGAVVDRLLPIEGANRLFGVARIRALNIVPNTDCKVADQFSNAFPTCYGPFSNEAFDKDEYGPLNDLGVKIFQYFKDPIDDVHIGNIANYPPGGHMKAITADYLKTSAEFREMETSGFINERTRAIFIDFTIYNFNLGLYAVCRMVYEVAPSGDWTTTFTVDVLIQRHLTALGNGNTEDWLLLIGEAVLVLFVLRYLLEEASEFLGVESKGGRCRPTIKVDYFFDPWNLLDWANMLMMIATLCYKIMTWGKAAPLAAYIGDPEFADVMSYTNFSSVAKNIRLIHTLTAFNAILTWFKAVKYINIIPYITTLMSTVEMAKKAIGSWVIISVSVLIGFTLAFNVAFGEQITAFRTPWMSFIFIMRTVLGDSDMSAVYAVSPTLGALLILMYVVAVFFVILNLFYAIIVMTLSEAKTTEDLKSERSRAQTTDRLKNIWALIKVNLRLELRFRVTFPGLYARLQNKKKGQIQKEKSRDQMVVSRKIQNTNEDVLALGPGNPVWGRRPKRVIAKIGGGGEQEIEDAQSSESEESEVDLGPVRNQDQLLGVHMLDTFNKSGTLKDKMSGHSIPGTQPAGDKLEDEAIDLIIDATKHIAAGVV